MKKNIMLLIVSILGVAKISAFGFTPKVNEAAVACFLNQAAGNIGNLLQGCGGEVQTVILNPNNIDPMALAKSIANDPACWFIAEKAYTQYSTACISLGNIVSFS